MAENKEVQEVPLKGAYSGVGFRHYYVDGVDLYGSDLVTDLARDLVLASDRDYLFMCVSVGSTSSKYELCLADDISYDGSTFSCPDADVYTFQVSVTNSVLYNSCSGSINTVPSTDFTYNAPNRTHLVNISPSVVHSVHKNYTLVRSEFYYSSETAFQFRTKSQEVNLLACIAFILAVLGVSLWFASIFRNVQRR